MESKPIVPMKKNSDKMFIQWIYGYAAQLLFLVLLIIALFISTPVFLNPVNLINVMRQVSTNMCVACAMTMVLIIGGIDLSVSSVMAVSGMVAAYMSLAGIPFFYCAVVGLLTGAASGFIDGLIVAYTEMPPFIVTYAMQSILRGIVYVITIAGTLRLTDNAFLEFGGGNCGFLPWPVVYMIIVIILTALIMNRSKMGRHMYAIGGNPKAAEFAGINTKRIKIVIYTISGVCAALSGLILTSRNTSMQPSLAIGAEMDAIAAVVLGGTSMAGGQGAIFGTILGALIMGIINNGLNLLGMDSFYQYIAKGLIILVAVYMDDVKNKRVRLGIRKV